LLGSPIEDPHFSDGSRYHGRSSRRKVARSTGVRPSTARRRRLTPSESGLSVLHERAPPQFSWQPRCGRGPALGWAVGAQKKKSVHGKAVRPCATPTAHGRYDRASSNSSMKRANSGARAPRKACLREHASACYSTRSPRPCGQRTARKCRTKKQVVFTQMMVATFGPCGQRVTTCKAVNIRSLAQRHCSSHACALHAAQHGASGSMRAS
jgi:hypothetical protein